MPHSAVSTSNVIPFPRIKSKNHPNLPTRPIASVLVTLDDQNCLTLGVNGATQENAPALCEALSTITLKLSRLAQGKDIDPVHL